MKDFLDAPSRPLAHRAVRGAGLVLASSYVNMAMGIIYGIVMARLLAPEHFGIFALAMFFLTFLDLRGKLGLEFAFVHRQPTTDALIATHIALQIGAALVTMLLVSICAFLLLVFHYPSILIPIMIALAAAMVVDAAGIGARTTLEKELAFARSTAVITISLLMSYLCAVILAVLGFGYWALVVQVAINALISSLGFWWVWLHPGRKAHFKFEFDRTIAKWILRFGATMALGSVATVVLLQFDNFLVGTLVSTAALGFYAQAYKVAQWPTGLVTHIVSRVALPTYARLQDDPPRLAKTFGMTLWLILSLATPLALALFVAAPDFLRLLYGDRWLPSAPLLRALAGYSILRPLLDDTGALFTAIGKPKQITIVLVVQAVTLIGVGTPLTLTYGAFGTAIAVGIAFAFGIALVYYLVARTIPIQLLPLFLPILISGVVSIALYYLFANLVDLDALPLVVTVMVKGGFAGGVFLAILMILERARMLERANYVWQLLRGQSA